MIDELKGDVQDAIQELRALAHGIFPPLLVSRRPGRGAAGRRPAGPRCPRRVDADGRRPLPHRDRGGRLLLLPRGAAERRQARRRRRQADRAGVGGRAACCSFEVADDGAGFDAVRGRVGTLGHGFVNMADRLGAIGGTVDVQSSPGHGTTISGHIPVHE